MGHNAIHDAGALLHLLADHVPAQVEVDGLTYREGLNAVSISGGIAGNVIPDRCRVEINYRFAPDKSAAEAEAYVRDVLPGFELTVTDVAIGARPGLDQPAAAEFLAAVGAEASAKFVCIIDPAKQVDLLGRFPLPIEVIPMARSLVAREIVAKTGGQPVWREGVVTDNGNWILDVHNLAIVDPPALERDYNQITGVVCVGLFAARPADIVLIGDQIMA